MPLYGGPMVALIAFAAIALLGLVLRWAFSRSGGASGPIDWPPSDPEDFGLLAPVARTDTLDEARRIRARLADAGIKATTTVGADGGHRVLVFESEVDRARRVGGWSA